MNGFIFTMVCFALLMSVISAAILAEIINYFIRVIEYENRLKENRERVWNNFLQMGN